MKMNNMIIVCAIGASMLSPFAYGRAEKPRYRITDLGDLDQFNEVDAISYGVNDQNEVTGEATTDLPFAHAFIWLPIPAYGLTQGMHDIGPGPGSSSISRGNDIANTGHVTGHNKFAPSTIRHAFVWVPALTGSPSYARIRDMGVLIPEDTMSIFCDDNPNPCEVELPGGESSEGWAINDLV